MPLKRQTSGEGVGVEWVKEKRSAFRLFWMILKYSDWDIVQYGKIAFSCIFAISLFSFIWLRHLHFTTIAIAIYFGVYTLLGNGLKTTYFVHTFCFIKPQSGCIVLHLHFCRINNEIRIQPTQTHFVHITHVYYAQPKTATNTFTKVEVHH